MKDKQDESVTITAQIPRLQHAQLKHMAIDKGMTMYELISDAIAAYIKAQEGK